MPSAVPKPSDAGNPQLAITRIESAFVNIRNGPSTDYTDIGDILNNTLVTYYPDSRTDNGWVWVEQYGAAGWVSTGVITFRELATASLPDYPPTPYDGKSAIWHWKGEGVADTTIAQLAENIKSNAPNISQVWVKVSDGNQWQGDFDSGQLAINGPDDIDRWVNALNAQGLELHLWSVLKGEDINNEAAILIQACQRPGVKSLILDIEPYAGYWTSGPEPIRPLMTQIRQALGGSFHIALSTDPRPQHYDDIHPQEWFPFINSVHPQTYWTTFRRPMLEVVEEMYSVWGNYGRPILPVLPASAPVSEQLDAGAMIAQRFLSKGVSWWRYGVISQWEAVNVPVTVRDVTVTDPTEQPPTGTQFADEVIIFAGQDGFRSGTYTGRDEFTRFTHAMGWEAMYTSTEVSTSKVWAEWRTQLPASGLYQISVFVSGRHSTTRKARYKIHAVRGTTTEVVVDLNQSIYRNQWVPLGVFDLVREQANAGKVFLNDVTGEGGREIAFDAVRLRHIVPLSGDQPDQNEDIPDIIDGVHIADGFDSPVGTQAERNGTQVWPSGWRDASPFGVLYFAGTAREAYHTGADLNWGTPYEDKGLPVYACASGVVVYAETLRVWGNVIVIRHDPLRSPTGRVVYSRYGHVQNMIVKAGDRVRRGQQISEVGDALGTLVPHLHFDISITSKLETSPGDWPGTDLARLYQDYTDPLVFVRNNRP